MSLALLQMSGHWTVGMVLGEVMISISVKAGHERTLAVITEGVEAAAQEQELGRLGGEEAQGFLYGSPEPVGVIERYLGTCAHDGLVARDFAQS